MQQFKALFILMYSLLFWYFQAGSSARYLCVIKGTDEANVLTYFRLFHCIQYFKTEEMLMFKQLTKTEKMAWKE